MSYDNGKLRFTWGRKQVEMSAQQFIAALALLLLGGLAYSAIRAGGAVSSASADMRLIREEHQAMLAAIGKLTAATEQAVTAQGVLVEEVQITSYLVALPQEQRPRLMLPRGLQGRVVGQGVGYE